jgi:signal transduction histidine kinase
MATVPAMLANVIPLRKEPDLLRESQVSPSYTSQASPAALIDGSSSRGREFTAMSLFPNVPDTFVVAMPVHPPLNVEPLQRFAAEPVNPPQPRAEGMASLLEGISEISHELRNSLALIRGSSQLLMELDTDESRYHASVVNEEAVRLGRLVEDLLDLSRFELDKFRLVPAWINLGAVVQEAADTTALLAQTHAVQVHLPVAIPPVYADATRIHQVLVNLLTNAMKYSPAGSPVSVTVTVEGSVEKKVLVSVHDEGPGIPDAVKPYLFEPFCPTGISSAQVNSVGLGLAISRRIIEAHGGRIGATSQEGKGTTFTSCLDAGCDTSA